MLLYYHTDQFDLPKRTKGAPFLDPEEPNSAETNVPMIPIELDEDSRRVLSANAEKLDGESDLLVKDEESIAIEPTNVSTVSDSVSYISEFGGLSSNIITTTQKRYETTNLVIGVQIPFTSVPVDEFNLCDDSLGNCARRYKSLTEYNSNTSPLVLSP